MGKGLYRNDYEHDACGVGMVVNIHGNKSHQLVDDALRVLENMQHRGAEGADMKTGDGAGIMLQIPHEFILLQGIPVPEKGKYGTGLVFLPKDEQRQEAMLRIMIEEIEREGLQLMHLRSVPVCSDCLGAAARATEPAIKQMFVTGVSDDRVPLFEQMLYAVRKRMEQRIGDADFYVCSLSARNIVYKGMLTSMQLRRYYLDLTNDYFTSGVALVHSRFSTNTMPRWSLAQPFRLIAHNGEINTIRGNRGWMKARGHVLPNGEDVLQPGMSDSASLDNALEYLVMSGLSLPHAMAILVPEAFGQQNPISDELKAFYEYHSILMEPWDGPAALLFCDGRYAGGMLDRNGLRPARYTITKNDTMVVASEAGVLFFEPSEVVEKGRLQPGKMLMVDTQQGCILRDSDIKSRLASAHPYGQWLAANRIQLEKLKSGRHVENTVTDLAAMELLFGYGREDIDSTIMPMCAGGQEPTAAMGNDTPLAVLDSNPQSFFNYFRQQFAQVTNPAIDSIREGLVMSLTEYIGRVGPGILSPSEDNCKMVRLPHPILTNAALDMLCHIGYKGFNTIKLPMTFAPHLSCENGNDNDNGNEKIVNCKSSNRKFLITPSQGEALRLALDKLCKDAEQAVDNGYNYIILTDNLPNSSSLPQPLQREGSPDEQPDCNPSPFRGRLGGGFFIPSLLAVSAVHHHLIRAVKRVQTALIVESGEIRETMHAALLLGYGASAVCPWLAYGVIDDLVRRHAIQEDYATAEANYIKAMKKGLLKIMAKMGISTIRSYRGAKIFESIGLSEQLLRTYFDTDVSAIGGIGLDEIARDAIRRRNAAFATPPPSGGGWEGAPLIPYKGQFHWRRDGIRHAWNPQTIATLQLACRQGSYEKYKQFSHMAANTDEPLFVRDLFAFKRSPIPIDKVEPVEAIVSHFVTGAMSFGALSKEAHETICLAMNKLGGRSNTGEGGEDRARYHAQTDGISLSSKTKQIASGRFGVTAEYLVNAEEIQIKVAQGAKPGEGGQLPGFKVDEVIARTRHSIAGISLISPPPHHDIYSIEDLAQLIFDLKNVNPQAAVSVKLVAESGIGTIAAGVAKAKADLIVVSGAEGGTGASPASSMRFAGIPPEIGLAETQQTLVRNRLRSQVRLQVDGQLKTGRDVVAMALLGADEFAFGTSALIVLGCVMMRKCNQNTCPMGVATQDASLRAHFRGHYSHLVNYFTFVAQEVRELLADMGFRSLNDIIGHTEIVNGNGTSHLDLSRLLYKESETHIRYEGGGVCAENTDRESAMLLSQQLVGGAKAAIENREEVSLDFTIKNTDRACGTLLSGIVARKYGAEGLPPDTIKARFRGSAGQSFGAFLMKGISFKLEGEANDYVAKGLSGGVIAIQPPLRANYKAEDNVIVGNTGLYGATSGELYINGKVGERFAVRNSGAIAVVEGAGDHCCEYMTGGRVVVLGTTGRNFAAGMSGGMAYVWDKERTFDYYCNMDMVEISLVEEAQHRKELHQLIRQHYLHTGSKLALQMLDDWNHYVNQFIQVVPIEYKRVLHEEQMRKLQQKIADVQRDY